ncbi:MAG: type III secretion HpaP family protein [Planctomycetota bacterium]|jgi:hypothetical protein|nr:type III secretion HpaP family protein [Planctomycetota bacterium]
MDTVRTRAAGETPAQGAANPGTRAKGGENKVPESDARRMGEALEGKGKRAGGPAGGGQGRDRPGELTALFHQALGSLNGQAGTPADIPRVANAPEARGADTAAAARCGELVDRILASAPAADGSAEVRLTIDKPWLPETEVRLTLTADARLEVEFRTDSAEAQRFLSPNLETLRDRLAEKSGGEVAVRLTEGPRESGGVAVRTAEGLRESGGVTVRTAEGSRESGGDGRSRNRREAIEELEEE